MKYLLKHRKYWFNKVQVIKKKLRWMKMKIAAAGQLIFWQE